MGDDERIFRVLPALRFPRGRQGRKYPITLLLAAVPEYVKLMVETAVSTGMRISEILGLKWRYVDLTLGVVKVEERLYRGETGEPKSERARRVLPRAC